MPVIPSGAILSVVAQSKVFGQTNMLTMHYRLDQDFTFLDGDMDELIDALHDEMEIFGGLSGLYAAALSEDAVDIFYKYQFIWPLRYIIREKGTANDVGLVAEPALPPATQHGITLRGDLANRHNRGTKHIGAVPPSFTEEGEITTDGLAALTPLAAQMAAEIPFTADGLNWTARPVIYDRSNAGGSAYVTNYTVPTSTRTDRRRVVGRGI